MSSVRYLFDEDFNGKIIRGLRRRSPNVDTLTVFEAGLCGMPDSEILAWSAYEGRLLVSHDYSTMRAEAEARLSQALNIAGLLLVRQNYPFHEALEELALICEATSAHEWYDLILFLPL